MSKQIHNRQKCDVVISIHRDSQTYRTFRLSYIVDRETLVQTSREMESFICFVVVVVITILTLFPKYM